MASAIEARGDAPKPISGTRSPRPTSAGRRVADTRLMM